MNPSSCHLDEESSSMPIYNQSRRLANQRNCMLSRLAMRCMTIQQSTRLLLLRELQYSSVAGRRSDTMHAQRGQNCVGVKHKRLTYNCRMSECTSSIVQTPFPPQYPRSRPSFTISASSRAFIKSTMVLPFKVKCSTYSSP